MFWAPNQCVSIYYNCSITVQVLLLSRIKIFIFQNKYTKSLQKRTNLNWFSVMGFSCCSFFLPETFFSGTFFLVAAFWSVCPTVQVELIDFLWHIYDCYSSRRHGFSNKTQKSKQHFLFPSMEFMYNVFFSAQLFIPSQNKQQNVEVFFPAKHFLYEEKTGPQTVTYATSCCGLWQHCQDWNHQVLYSLQFPVSLTEAIDGNSTVENPVKSYMRFTMLECLRFNCRIRTTTCVEKLQLTKNPKMRILPG